MFVNIISVWIWNDKCLFYVFMFVFMVYDDGFGWYGLSKCINICLCMYFNEKEYWVNVD